jgi:hypothetical protein
MLRFKQILVPCVFAFISHITYGQSTKSDSIEINWHQLSKGLYFSEVDAPEASHIVDSAKISILKIEPHYFEFEFFTATQYGKKARTAPEWSNEFGFSVIANAGMYSPNKNQTSKGYLKNKDHINNSKVLPHYNAVIALHPKDTTLAPARIFDLTCTSFTKLRTQYQSFVQGMRMIDCEGIPLAWDKNPDQLCSMILASTDTAGNFYFFFTRAPFAHRQMISFLLAFRLNLRETIYLEGGPEASLYIKSTNQTIERHGTYVSKTWEKTDNSEFWKLPNVVAIRPKL